MTLAESKPSFDPSGSHGTSFESEKFKVVEKPHIPGRST